MQKTLARHPSVRLGVVILVVGLLAVFLVGAYAKAARPGGYDVHCFLSTARAVRAGENPYGVPLPIPYNYPLFACTAAVPLTFLPESLVHLLWFCATLAAWATAALLLVRRCPAEGAWPVLVLASLVLLGPIQNHLLNGQTGAFVLLLCVLFWRDWTEERPHRAALWLGMGIALKLVPALFVVSLVLRRSWGVLIGATLWTVAFAVLLPGLFLGSGVLTAYDHYARTVLFPELSASLHSAHYPHDFTLRGGVAWFVPAWRGELVLKVVTTLLVLACLCWAELRAGDRLARLEMYLAAILLLSPLSQPHHLTLLLPTVWLLALRGFTWLDVLPFALLPLWKLAGGPLEAVAVVLVFVGAVRRGATTVSLPGTSLPADRAGMMLSVPRTL